MPVASAREIVRGVPAALGRRAVGDWAAPGLALEAAAVLFLPAPLHVSAQVARDAVGGRRRAAGFYAGLVRTEEQDSANEVKLKMA